VLSVDLQEVLCFSCTTAARRGRKRGASTEDAPVSNSGVTDGHLAKIATPAADVAPLVGESDTSTGSAFDTSDGAACLMETAHATISVNTAPIVLSCGRFTVTPTVVADVTPASSFADLYKSGEEVAVLTSTVSSLQDWVRSAHSGVVTAPVAANEQGLHVQGELSGSSHVSSMVLGGATELPARSANYGNELAVVSEE
jgi:hypothetical protein